MSRVRMLRDGTSKIGERVSLLSFTISVISASPRSDLMHLPVMTTCLLSF